MIKIILIVVLAVVLLKMIVRSLLPWLIKREFIDKNNSLFKDVEANKGKKSQFDGKGEYVDYEDLSDDEKKTKK